MKRILALLALSVGAAQLPGAANAQDNDVRVRTYALRGPVQTMRLEEATVISKDGKFVEGPRILRMTAVFSEDGGRPEFGIYDEKGALTRRIEIKYEGGRETEFLNYDGAGSMWLKGVNIYDENGFVKEKATYNGDGSLRSKTTYKRNAKGAAVEWAETDAKGNYIDRWVNTFDAAGELSTSERTTYRPDGSVSSKEFRDLRAKRSESVFYNQNGSIAQTRVREDRRINEFGPDGSLQRTIEISNPDRLPTETVHNSDGTANNYAPIADELDSHGNWTKQTRWVSDANGRRPVKVAYRTLTYFSDSKVAPDK
jgi:hypothetical protein